MSQDNKSYHVCPTMGRCGMIGYYGLIIAVFREKSIDFSIILVKLDDDTQGWAEH